MPIGVDATAGPGASLRASLSARESIPNIISIDNKALYEDSSLLGTHLEKGGWPLHVNRPDSCDARSA